MDRKAVIIGLLIAIIIAGIIALFASSSPDGLEKVAADKGFLHKGEIGPSLKSPFADYRVPKIPSPRLAISLAGIFGTLAVFFITCWLANRLKEKGN